MTKLHNMVIDDIQLCMVLECQGEHWELTLMTLGDKRCSVKTGVYLCLKDGYQVWVETTKGIAIQKFMNLICNRFRDKIPEVK